MRTSDHINQYRNKTHPLYKSEDSIGMNGFFVLPLSKEEKTYALVIASDGQGVIPWEHVSVRVAETKYHGKMKERTPRWDEMSVIKALFWEDDECVMQLHPPEKDHINLHPHVLHLWRPTDVEIPMPPVECV